MYMMSQLASLPISPLCTAPARTRQPPMRAVDTSHTQWSHLPRRTRPSRYPSYTPGPSGARRTRRALDAVYAGRANVSMRSLYTRLTWHTVCTRHPGWPRRTIPTKQAIMAHATLATRDAHPALDALHPRHSGITQVPPGARKAHVPLGAGRAARARHSRRAHKTHRANYPRVAARSHDRKARSALVPLGAVLALSASHPVHPQPPARAHPPNITLAARRALHPFRAHGARGTHAALAALAALWSLQALRTHVAHVARPPDSPIMPIMPWRARDTHRAHWAGGVEEVGDIGLLAADTNARAL